MATRVRGVGRALAAASRRLASSEAARLPGADAAPELRVLATGVDDRRLEGALEALTRVVRNYRASIVQCKSVGLAGAGAAILTVHVGDAARLKRLRKLLEQQSGLGFARVECAALSEEREAPAPAPGAVEGAPLRLLVRCPQRAGLVHDVAAVAGGHGYMLCELSGTVYPGTDGGALFEMAATVRGVPEGGAASLKAAMESALGADAAVILDRWRPPGAMEP